MSVLMKSGSAGAGGGGLSITNSVRLRASASAYFSRTPSAGTQNKWTLSCWVKRSILGSGIRFPLLQIGTASSDTASIQIGFGEAANTDQILIGGGVTAWKKTTALYRDPSAWYHVFVVCDTSLGAGSRMKLYVNGVIPALTTDTEPGAGANTAVFTNAAHYIGYNQNAVLYADGYLSDYYLLEGVAAAATDFGQTDANGVWVPKAYTGSYGTRGFHLDFKDAALTVASNVGLGKDVSGNGNYWVTNNISVTAGVTYDSMVDTPTNNYATLNPLDYGAGSLAEANLNFGAMAPRMVRATQALPSTGKWYWEVFISAVGLSSQVGISGSLSSLTNYLGAGSDAYSYAANAIKYNNGSSSAYGATYTTNDVIAFAYDADAGTLTAYKNNATQGTMYSSLSGTLFPAVGYGSGTGTGSYHINFGQRPFTYTPPTGFKALCTANLPAVAITNPRRHFDVNTRSGTGASATKTGLGFQPDLVWVKARSAATDHKLTDAVRGVTKALISDTTGAETTDANGVTAFTSDGYTVGSDTNYNNSTGPVTYVDWLWKANGAGVSNTAGSITSTVSANTTAGFSVVKIAAGTAANATVGHGLGKVLSLVIAKAFSQVTEWPVYHASLANTEYLVLNTTAAKATGATYWNSTTPTSSVFSLGSSTNTNNTNGMLFYCFAEIAGFSKFGSYTGNGSADGPFVFCGFRPRWILVKISSGVADHWRLYDTARDTYNQTNTALEPNAVSADASIAGIDVTANGFKLRGTDNSLNANTSTYIYAAFSEYPFGGSNCSPSPAR